MSLAALDVSMAWQTSGSAFTVSGLVVGLLADCDRLSHIGCIRRRLLENVSTCLTSFVNGIQEASLSMAATAVTPQGSLLQRPEPAKVGLPQDNSPAPVERSDDEREATELQPVGRESATVFEVRQGTSSGSGAVTQERHTWLHPLSRFWNRYIHVAVSHDDCRDHFGQC